MPFDEYRPHEGWIAWQRKQERKEKIEGAIGAFFAFLLYASVETMIFFVEV